MTKPESLPKKEKAQEEALADLRRVIEEGANQPLPYMSDAEAVEWNNHLEARKSNQIPSDNSDQSARNRELYEHVLKEYLSYQDADIPEEAKQEALEYSEKSESAKKYVESLLALAKKYRFTRLESEADRMRDECASILERIGVQAGPYAESRTWSLWDIAKQYHYVLHPDESDARYDVADPFESEEKRAEIVNRHVGWEAYGSSRQGDNDFLDLLSEDKQSAVIELLTQPPKENGTLSSKELAELGALLRV